MEGLEKKGKVYFCFSLRQSYSSQKGTGTIALSKQRCHLVQSTQLLGFSSVEKFTKNGSEGVDILCQVKKKGKTILVQKRSTDEFPSVARQLRPILPTFQLFHVRRNPLHFVLQSMTVQTWE